MKKLFLIISLLICLWANSQSRLYFPNASYTSDINSYVPGQFTDETQSIIRPMQSIWQLNSYITTGPINVEVTAGSTTLLVQYVSPPLAAQTFGNSFKAQMRGFVSSTTSTDISIFMFVVFISPSGGLRAFPMAGPVFSTSLSTVSTNRTITGTLTSSSVQTGDRLVILIGFKRNSGTIARTGSIVFGGGNLTDLPEDNTTTTSGFKSWVEFSQTLKLNNGIF